MTKVKKFGVKINFFIYYYVYLINVYLMYI